MGKKYFIGIDPGAKGAIHVLGEANPGVSDTLQMPLYGKNQIDCNVINNFIFRRVKGELPLVYVAIEKAQSMPGQGVASMFKYGKGYGKLLGMLETLMIAYEEVGPRTWKKAILFGTEKDKLAAIEFVKKKYPHVDLIPGRCKKPQDGIADAVCIAEYARLKG